MGEVLKDPFEPVLPDSQPEVTQETKLKPGDLEPLADWIINHETQISEAKKKLPPEELTEIHFERRHEVKDQLEQETAQSHATKPMVPISQILQSRNLQPTSPDPKKHQVTLRRLRQILKPSTTTYAAAMLQGFAAGLAIVIVVLVIWSAKLLVRQF